MPISIGRQHDVAGADKGLAERLDPAVAVWNEDLRLVRRGGMQPEDGRGWFRPRVGDQQQGGHFAVDAVVDGYFLQTVSGPQFARDAPGTRRRGPRRQVTERLHHRPEHLRPLRLPGRGGLGNAKRADFQLLVSTGDQCIARGLGLMVEGGRVGAGGGPG